MKVVAIVGSNRRGNTYEMVRVAARAVSKSAQVDIIMLGDMTYSMCDGCLQCDDAGVCHYVDDMQAAIQMITEADGLIIGSPARWGLLSGELKGFFDRLNPLASPELLAGKKAVIFVVGQSEEASDDSESVRSACGSIETFCDSADIEVVDRVYAYGCLVENDVKVDKKVLKRCMDASRKLVEVI